MCPLKRANLSEDSDQSSPTKIQKPYNFLRGKISFNLEDLENSNKEDDDFSPHMPKPSHTAVREQPSRTCKSNKTNIGTETAKDFQDFMNSFKD